MYDLIKYAMCVCSVSGSKILGWFKNQRTAVGKLYKKKSGQAAKSLTKRQQWQEKSFGFLKEAIEPRTYTKDTASVSIANIQFLFPLPSSFSYCLLPLASSCILIFHFDILGVVFCLQVRSRVSDEEDDGAGSSVSAARGTSEPPPSKAPKKAKNLEDAMLAYLSAPTGGSTGSTGRPAELGDPTDERPAFANWFASRLHKVPDGQ